MKLVLGLEIHLHLKTERKMFCFCSADIYGAEPNTHTCPVCLGLPGALPVPNADAVKKAQLLGLALNSKLNVNSHFDRKHYHYHDLPKGYQISQYQEPLCVGGFLEFSGGKRIELDRIHLEEDTAKSLHEKGKTLIDFNKSGIPLVEIVTKPVFESVEDAVVFSKKIQEIVRALEIGDVDMEKGQMRLEANISLSEDGSLPNYKVEIKNINSFKFMEKAVLAEIRRQSELFENGETPLQENRGYDEDKNVTVPQREKEFAHDYRYFPEPDIPPMEFSDAYFEDLRSELPELNEEKLVRLEQSGLTRNLAEQLISKGVGSVNLYNDVKENSNLGSATIANIIINRPEFSSLSTISFIEKVKESESQIKDGTKLNEVANEVIAENPDAVASYKNGKASLLQFLVGQSMKKTSGKADPTVMAELLKNLMEVA